MTNKGKLSTLHKRAKDYSEKNGYKETTRRIACQRRQGAFVLLRSLCQDSYSTCSHTGFVFVFHFIVSFVYGAFRWVGFHKAKIHRSNNGDNAQFMDKRVCSISLPFSQAAQGIADKVDRTKGIRGNSQIQSPRISERESRGYYAADRTSAGQGQIEMPMFYGKMPEILDGKHHKVVWFTVPHGARRILRYAVRSTRPVSVYITNEKGIRQLRETGKFWVLVQHSPLVEHEYQIKLPSYGTWALLIMNKSTESAAITYELYRQEGTEL